MKYVKLFENFLETKDVFTDQEIMSFGAVGRQIGEIKKGIKGLLRDLNTRPTQRYTIPELREKAFDEVVKVVLNNPSMEFNG